MNDFTGLGTGTGFNIAVLLQFVDNAAGAAEPEPEFPLKHGNGNNVLVREPVENDIIHFIVPAVVFVEVRFKGCIAVFAEIDLVIGTALFFPEINDRADLFFRDESAVYALESPGTGFIEHVAFAEQRFRPRAVQNGAGVYGAGNLERYAGGEIIFDKPCDDIDTGALRRKAVRAARFALRLLCLFAS